MRDNKQNLEQRLADILSEYVDRLNEGGAPSIEDFLNRYGSFAQDLKLLLEATAFVKDKTQVQGVPKWKKVQAFRKVRARLLAPEHPEKAKDTAKETASLLRKRWHPVLLLLWARGKIGRLYESIKGRTRMDKLVFVMKMEGKFTQFIPDFYAFEPYRFGPYEKELFQDLETLKCYGLVEIVPPSKLGKDIGEETEVSEGLYEEKDNTIYRLTEKGKQFADALAEKVFEIGQEYENTRQELQKYEGLKDVLESHAAASEAENEIPEQS